MTAFAFPLNIKRVNENESGVGANTLRGRVRGVYRAAVSVGGTGTTGTTTIPLFVLPAGSYISDAELDITTAFDQTAGVNVAIGVATSTGIIFAATTVNTAGRRVQTPSGAQVSAWAIALTADTTVQAVVSIITSAITTGEVLVRVFVE